MWRFYLVLVFTVVSIGQATAEDDKHAGLPDNLEIIDPKSLGLSDSDVEKFLGNVKLLDTRDMGDNIKTQILTVGFDGDEKLNLADFENLSTDGLPDGDRGVAQQAFQRFQDFFKKPENSKDFDKFAAEAEAEKDKYTVISSSGETGSRSTSPSSSFDSETTVRYNEESTGNPFQEFQREQQRTTIQPATTTPETTQRPDESDSKAQQQQFNSVNNEQIYNLIKTAVQHQPQELPKFGGFISPDTYNGHNFIRYTPQHSPRPQSPAVQQQQQKQQQQERQQQEQQQNQQQQQSIQQQVFRQQQNEVQPQQQFVVQNFINPAQTGPNQAQNFQIPIVKPTAEYARQNNLFPSPQPVQIQVQPQQQQQLINPVFLSQPQSTQQPAQLILTHAPQHHHQQQQPQIFPIHVQPTPAQLQRFPQQPQQQFQGQNHHHHHHQQQQQQQQRPVQNQIPFQFEQQQGRQVSPVPFPAHHALPIAQHINQNFGQQQQQQPNLTPVHSVNFQPPQKLVQNFTPNHGPPRDAVNVTPRPGFQVTPSSPMIPISTVENAIHRPPVIPQHVHHNHNQHPQQQQRPGPGNHHADQVNHQNIVAEFARQQHLRISQQPAVLPSHPPQAQQQLQQQQGRELKYNLPPQQQQQQQQRPIYNQQQPQVFQQRPAQASSQINVQTSPNHFQGPPPQQQQQQQQRQPQPNFNQQQQFPQNRPGQFPPQQFNSQPVHQILPFQRPVNSHFPPSPPARPSPPTRNFFPNGPPPPPPSPTKVNHLVKDSNRFNANQIPQQQQQQQQHQHQHQHQQQQNPNQYRPPQNPQFSPLSNPNFRQNLIPLEANNNEQKVRFQGRPEIPFNNNNNNNNNAPQFPNIPHRFSYNPYPHNSNINNNNNNNHRQIPQQQSQQAQPQPIQQQQRNSFGDSVREARQFTFEGRTNGEINSNHNSRPNQGNNNNNNNNVSNNSKSSSSSSTTNGQDLLAGGSEHHSLAVTKDLLKPDFIESIQPSRMVAYKYLTSSEN